jgi:hypothetical protein
MRRFRNHETERDFIREICNNINFIKVPLKSETMQTMQVINASRFDSTIIFRFVILLFHVSFDDNIYRMFESMATVLMQ